ncbi:MAG: AAA family ATPase [Rhabdochlamydiaceae bacterium]|nr:AAA family ATPase [Rhabdochlamydiaceae bacterium]
MLSSFFIASTGQHVGKTTLSLGLLSGLRKRGIDISYMKPIGQEVEQTQSGVWVDKDALLIKEHFGLKSQDAYMSPVLVTSGFTKDFLDQKIQTKPLLDSILYSYEKLKASGQVLVVEGTGHMGVGSILDLNNAQVAKELKLPVLLIASGGLGSSFDELTLSKTLCDVYQVPVAGVILNRVKPEKKDKISLYMKKALERWNVPLLGCIPIDSILGNPSIYDLKSLLGGTFLSGEQYQLRHFTQIRLAAASAAIFRESIEPHQLIITPAHREEIILTILAKYWELQSLQKDVDLGFGLILTGQLAPRNFVIEELQRAKIPALHIPLHSDEILDRIGSFTAKIQKEDEEKIQEAISLVEQNIDFPLLLNLLTS